jgi:2-methylcitrate dehydratase PrpD
LTQALGKSVARIVTEGATAAERNVARIGFVDTIATLIAGRHEPATTTLISALAPWPAGPVPVVFGNLRTQAEQAALINGVAAHALDYDDVALRGHPSAVMVPAILSLGYALGSSGIRMLDAYVAGYEVWASLVDREPAMHHLKGWHPTGIFGSIGAAAACCVLLELDATRCAHAIGLGATQSAGLMSNFGAMAKPFHAGRAAQAGLVAARLAAGGFTASPDAIEHPQGFLAAVSPGGAVDRLSPFAVEKPRQIASRRMNLKKYPTCYYTHRALDALLELLATERIEPAQVERVEVTMSREHATVLRNHQPTTGLAAKFSIEFAMAGGLIAGRVGLSELNDAFVNRPDVQQLMARVSTTFSEVYDPETLGAALADSVVLTMRDGTCKASGAVGHAVGHPQRPLSEEALRNKFLDALEYGGYTGDATAFYARVIGMESSTATDLMLCESAT